MASDQGHAGLASSLTDLMTSLAVIFILLLVASLNNTQQEGETTRNAILLKLRERMEKELAEYKDQGFEVKQDPKDPLGLIVVVPKGLLNFQVGKSDVPPEGMRFLRTIVPKMAATICSEEFKREVDSIIVEGHADKKGSDEINLPLSQERSMAVVKETLQVLGSFQQNGDAGTNHRACFLEFLSATGRGSAEPVLDKDGNEDQNRSRRVVFKIRVRSLEQRLIKEMLGGGEAAPPTPGL